MPATRCVPLPGCLLFGFVFVAVRLFSACNCCAVSWSTKLLAFTFSFVLVWFLLFCPVEP